MSKVRWTLVVPESTDRALRTYLGKQGMRKGDLSRFVDEAVRARLFELAIGKVKERNRDADPDELLEIIDEAVNSAWRRMHVVPDTRVLIAALITAGTPPDRIQCLIALGGEESFEIAEVVANDGQDPAGVYVGVAVLDQVAQAGRPRQALGQPCVNAPGACQQFESVSGSGGCAECLVGARMNGQVDAPLDGLLDIHQHRVELILVSSERFGRCYRAAPQACYVVEHVFRFAPEDVRINPGSIQAAALSGVDHRARVLPVEILLKGPHQESLEAPGAAVKKHVTAGEDRAAQLGVRALEIDEMDVAPCGESEVPEHGENLTVHGMPAAFIGVEHGHIHITVRAQRAGRRRAEQNGGIEAQIALEGGGQTRNGTVIGHGAMIAPARTAVSGRVRMRRARKHRALSAPTRTSRLIFTAGWRQSTRAGSRSRKRAHGAPDKIRIRNQPA